MKRTLTATLTALLVLTGCEHHPIPFRSCAQASRLNAAPHDHTHPRWNRTLDRDHDGQACETDTTTTPQ